MGTRAERPLLTLLAASLLLALAGAAGAADVSTTPAPAISSATVPSVSTAAVPSISSATVPVAPPPSSISTAAYQAPPPPTAPPDTLAADAVEALRGLAASYSSKRRTPFMKLVSDDFLGDLGTLEDALSSDFRSYRTIVLDVVPGRVDVRGLQAAVQFRYNMTVTDDTGNNSKFSGQAAYIFLREEKGKVRLYKMTGTPIFGTSLSSIENPVATSQGAPTGGNSQNAGGNTAPGCGSSVKGSAHIGANAGFNFTTQAQTAAGTGDFFVLGPDLSTNGGATITDLGACNFNTFTTPPAMISGTSAAGVAGDCYAIRTAAGKFAGILLTIFDDGGATFNYKFQPSGGRCF